MLTGFRSTRTDAPLFRTTERRTPDRPCLNCGDPTPGNYCRTCGQRKVEVHVSLGRMLMEALDDQFSINSALPRTLGALVARPGHLTREYMTGRIVRYIPPFRLYLITSVVFFLVLSLLPDLRDPNVNLGAAGTVTVGHAEVTHVTRPAPPAPVVRGRSGPGVLLPPVPPPPPAMGWLRGRIATGNPVLDSIANARLDHFRRMEPREATREIIRSFLGRVPQMMFVLLPIYAGLLMLLYLGSGRFYVEHFVFALHVHASAFLLYLGVIGLARWPGAVAVLLCWLMLYVYLAMKKVYGQGWIVTGIKYGVLAFAYVFLLAIGVSVAFASAILLE
ncbi:MAG TPA: DUF3667 domain-containing protein [Longimicrobiaceae bacterium]|nr:DUF3667 domain-containing protein [Longimicrobiaceae bacterium]